MFNAMLAGAAGLPFAAKAQNSNGNGNAFGHWGGNGNGGGNAGGNSQGGGGDRKSVV